MTEAQKAIIIFFAIPLIAVIIMRIFSPSGPYPTRGPILFVSYIIWIVAGATIAAVLYLVVKNFMIPKNK